TRCFAGVGKAECVHHPIIARSGRRGALIPAFKWVNTTLGNIKSAITGTYRAIRDKHVPRSLAEFEYRFNRRYDLAAMMPRLAYVALRTPPMPYRLLRLAEDHARARRLQLIYPIPTLPAKTRWSRPSRERTRPGSNGASMP